VTEIVPQGVPQGAVCATHVDAPAVATCRRCGTFVCAACVVAGPLGTMCGACAPKIGRTPWEERAQIGWFAAWTRTAKATLLDPTGFFRTHPADFGYGSPVLWAMLNALIGGFFSMLWGLAQTAIGMSLAGSNPMVGAMLGGGGENLVITVATFLLAPLIVVVSLFVMAGITHACLAMVGGANRSFDTTFRTLAYCQTTQLFQVVPILGPLAAFVWNIVIEIQGLAAAHGTSTGKAAAAIVIPLCVLGGCAIALVVALVSMGGMAGFPTF